MKKVFLLILDGWGIGNKDDSDAIYKADTPYIDSLDSSVPNASLKTFGENVGLPDGQMGNSEVGHMNIGAGRVVWQMLVRINKSFGDGSIINLPNMKRLLQLAQADDKRNIHLMGLVSDGGVHSSIEHLKGLTQIFSDLGLDNRVKIHAFMDGRDTDPKAGLGYLDEVMQSDGIGNAELSSICGRYYAMDRDKRWQRTQLAYNLLVNVEGEQFKSYQDAMQASYLNGVTDEFIKPISLNGEGIKEGDIVLSFNFRTDRGRQISQALTQQDFPEFNMSKIDINYFTMTEYDKTYTDVNVLFDNADLENTLGEILSNNKIPQLRAAETEKYPHVTFFFNGGREEPFDLEERIMANSPKVATYDLQPEMSALELTAKVKEQLITEKFGFVCVNYANPDMVGHTGVFSAIMKACETVDSCSKELVDTATQHGYTTIVIADHGNADKALNEDGSPNTAHSTNLVPVYLVNGRGAGINSGKLADVAPSILELLEIEKPAQMDGKSLIIK